LWVSSAMAWSSWCSSWDEGRGKLEYRKCGSNSWCPYCPWHFHGHLYKAMAQKNKTPIMRTSVVIIIIIILISNLWRRWVGDHPSYSLAKFGYKQDMKVKKSKIPSHFFLHARTQQRTLVIFIFS
jgi:hypothetical protein